MNGRLISLSLGLALVGAVAMGGAERAEAVLPRTGADSSWCMPTADVTAQLLHATIARLAADSGDVFAVTRDSLASMPQVPVSEVVLISQDSLCERASRMLDTAVFETPLSAPVYMLRVGQRYGIHPPTSRAGEFGIIVYTDTAFQVLAIGTI